MKSLRPIFDLIRERFLCLKQRHMNVMAPADMHMELALKLADIERRKA